MGNCDAEKGSHQWRSRDLHVPRQASFAWSSRESSTPQGDVALRMGRGGLPLSPNQTLLLSGCFPKVSFAPPRRGCPSGIFHLHPILHSVHSTASSRRIQPCKGPCTCVRRVRAHGGAIPPLMPPRGAQGLGPRQIQRRRSLTLSFDGQARQGD